MKSKQVVGLLAAAFIIFFTSIIGIFFASAMPTLLDGAYIKSDSPFGEYYAIVNVCGEIASYSENELSLEQPQYNHGKTLEYLDELIYDESNTGLILYLATPGGSAYTGVELYNAVVEYKKATNRPVVASMGEMCASAGYYVAAAADYIFASEESITGSIGVYMAATDTSGLYEKLGIRTVLIKTGNNKGAGAAGLPFTPEQEAVYQEIVDESYARFVKAVANGRGMSETDVIPLADGRIFTASSALNNGLIDEIGTFENASDYIAEITSSQGYAKDLSFYSVWDNMFLKISSILPKSESQYLSELAKTAKNGVMMLYDGV